MHTIVLIHGLWLTPRSWEGWKARFEERGHKVLAPAWPRMDGEVEDIRRDPSVLNGLGITEIVDHYDGIISGLQEPPVIMGHSFGGLVTELLLDRGLGAAGVGLSPAQVKGVLRLPPAQLRTVFPTLRNPANKNKSMELTPKQFRWAFTNTMSDEDTQAAYERYQVPGPGRVLFQAGLANVNPRAVTAVDFHNDERAPLLIISGGADHVSPPAVNRSELKHQQRSAAITAYKSFPDRPHLLTMTPGWEEVADYSLAWAQQPTETTD